MEVFFFEGNDLEKQTQEDHFVDILLRKFY